jgi:hypothetical protein
LEEALKEDTELQGASAAGHRNCLRDWFKEELGQTMGALLVPAEFRRRLEAVIANKKATGRLASKLRTKSIKTAPTEDKLRNYVEWIIENAGGKSMQKFKATADIFRARQSAALNFQSMVLGEIGRYAEVTLAYRQHAGKFPKFAKFNPEKNHWTVGTVDDQNLWKETNETFPDQPG